MTALLGGERSEKDIIETSIAHARILAGLHNMAFDDGWSFEAMRGLLLVSSTLGYLALSGEGNLQGFVLCRVVGDQADILTIAVVPLYRRMGVGRRLMVGLCQRLSAMRVESLFLEVAIGNGPALGLYKTLGFDAIGCRKGYYSRAGGALEDAVVMKIEPVKILGEVQIYQDRFMDRT